MQNINFTNLEIKNLDKDGFIIKKNILEFDQIDKIKKIIKSNLEGKGTKDSHYPATLKSFAIKAVKFNFKKIFDSFYFFKIKKKLNLDSSADIFFGKKSKLIMIDGYHNSIQNNEILPWHSDQAYSGAKTVKKINSPDLFSLKFFFYLTKAGSQNGCTSYIPGSHKITYAVRSCIYENIISYKPFWSIKDLFDFILDHDNYNKIVHKLGTETLLTDFLSKAKQVIENKDLNTFDFDASSGDLLIFNEGGLHKGSKPTKNERVVLRYLYSKSLN